MKADVRKNHDLTPAERERLVERHVEVMLQRKVEEDLRFLNAMQAAQLLGQSKSG
jgi:hypothetical protein